MKQFITAIFLLLTSQVMVYAGAPTQSATNLQFPAQRVDGDRLTLNFNKGNGAYRIVVIQEGAPVSEAPVNGVDYTANAVFGTKGTEFTAAEGYVVYRGKSSSVNVSVTVTGLRPGATYCVSIFEFNGKGTVTEYLMTALQGIKTTPPANEIVYSVKQVMTRWYSMENILKVTSAFISSRIYSWRVTAKDAQFEA